MPRSKYGRKARMNNLSRAKRMRIEEEPLPSPPNSSLLEPSELEQQISGDNSGSESDRESDLMDLEDFLREDNLEFSSNDDEDVGYVVVSTNTLYNRHFARLSRMKSHSFQLRI